LQDIGGILRLVIFFYVQVVRSLLLSPLEEFVVLFLSCCLMLIGRNKGEPISWPFCPCPRSALLTLRKEKLH